ncbi:MAG TPA: PepSY domain-containing protein [Paracoccaceae bacterium]|nr:PepSY domain-containing protein [Paracoccaceae bacterium]
MTGHTARHAAPAIAAALAAPAAEAADAAPGVTLGVTAGEIADALAAEGWEMTRYERESGRIEVHAEKDGRLGEIEADAATGGIRRIEEED